MDARAFGTRRRRRAPIINITSLIDVVFLLLIFFMLSSTFRDQFGIQVNLPTANTAEAQETQPSELRVNSEGQFFFDGKPLATENELRASLQTFVQENPEVPIVLAADAQANFGEVVRAIDIAREVGGTKLIIPTQSAPEPTTKSSPLR